MNLLSNSFSQDKVKDFGITFSPLTYLDKGLMSIRVGVDLTLFETIKTSFDYSYGDQNISMYPVNYIYSNKSFRPRISYILIKGTNYNAYLGIEYSYLKRRSEAKNFYSTIYGVYYLSDSGVLYKNKESFNLVLGVNNRFFRRLFFDFYFGLGYYRKINFLKFVGKVEIMESQPRRWFFPYRVGFFTGIQPVLGLKIGFYLW